MNNADKFREVFGIYATEMWAMPESEFLEWLNSEYVYGFRKPNILERLRMCWKCSLAPEECGRTNKILKYGNCIKRKEK